MPAKYIYLFCVIIKTNRVYLPVQLAAVGRFGEEVLCSRCGTI